MANITKESFEATIDSLLNANPRNSAKGNDMKVWFMESFSLNATVSNVKEDKQIGNRIAEQYKHKLPIVVFVCDEKINVKNLINRAIAQSYPSLNTLLIIVASENDGYSYDKLYNKTPDAFTTWAVEKLGVTVEPLSDNEKMSFLEDVIRQQIFYGAPGTGKSHRIKELLKALNVPKENIFRTTFHPDSDFSTFVGAYKPTMKKQYRYDGKVKAKYYEDDDLAGAKKDEIIIDKVIQYDFVPQTFIKAYVRAYQTNDNVYLIIEEINRGNCAQIFGDLFQLLDRDENGVSEYTIKADADIRAYLEDVLGCDSEGIKDGELCLPSNLYIYATMNTSDQSLFPIDSAFKRRWDWEYEPIKYKNADWVIEINGNQFSWTSFQKEVNNRIFESTNSEDKMLGDFFVKPYDGIITEKLLLIKVLFYLWNDVCKDGDGDIFKTEDNKDVKFSDLYGENGTTMLLSMMKHLKVELLSESDVDVEDDEEEQEDGVKVRYAINGEDKDEDGKDWKKGALVKRAVEIYCNNHPQDTATQIRDAWMSVGFLIPHIVETDDDKTQRINGSNDSRAAIRSKEIRLPNGESLHVSTQVGDGKQRKGFSDFIAKILSKPEWGINIQEV